MARQCTEVCYLTLKPGVELEGSSESAKVWADTIATWQQQEGYQRLFYGRTLGNPNLLMLMIDWTSQSAHEDFIKTPAYHPFLTHLQTIMESAHFHHINPTPSPPAILGLAPVIEFVTFFNIAPSFPANIQNFVDGIRQPKDYKGWAYGETVEDVRKHAEQDKEGGAKGLVLFLGWETVDAHMAFRQTEVFKQNVGFLREGNQGSELFHVKFTAV